MTPALRTTALCLALTFGGLATTAMAQTNPLYERAQTLQADKQAPHFEIGNTTYQVIPQAVVKPADPASQTANDDTSSSNRLRSAGSTDQAVAYIGPYAITLDDTAGPQARARSAQAADDGTGYTVVINMRTGQPTLMLPQLQLQVREPGQGPSLAQALGGTLLHDGPDSLLVILSFSNVDAALNALPKARAMDNVIHAQPTLQRRFRQLR